MAVGEIQISALPQASLPIELSDIFHLKQGIEDKRCTLEQLLDPHASLRNNPHGVTKVQVELGNVLNALQLVAANNLSDIVDVAEARANLQIMSSDEVNNIINIHINNKNNPHNVTKSQVGLGNLQNWTVSNLYNEDADKYATAKAVNSLYRAIQASYPIGTIHLSMNSANPSTYLLCGGTWELVSKGRALVGYSDSSRPVRSTFGNQTVSLGSNNIPAHTHSIYVTGGGHSHEATMSIISFDYGTKTTSSFDYGTKTSNTTGAHTHSVSGATNSAGEHIHHSEGQYPTTLGNSQAISGGRVAQWQTMVTTPNGAHTHSVSGTAALNGTHEHTLDIGSHTHVVNIGSHTHGGSVDISTTEHSHSGTTGSTGSGQAFNIEQPSFVLYVWERTA